MAVKCAKLILKEELADVKFEKIVVWADVGRHFQSKEFMHYCLFDLVKGKKCEVNVNFLVEKHGKNHRDGHFGGISDHLHDRSLEEPIKTVDDVARILSEFNKTKGILIKTQRKVLRILGVS